MNEQTTEQSAGATERAPAHVVVRGRASGFVQDVTSGQYHFRVDEPLSVGGTDSAPDPYDYLLASLGACTSMTVGLYARKRKWPLEEVIVSLWHARIHASDCADCETKHGMLHRIDLEIELTGSLAAEQRAKLLEIAHKCPIHTTLKSEIDIRVQALEAGAERSR
jgi:uncharacterized OsmC-like protein